MIAQSIQRSAVCRSLLKIALLGHLWNGATLKGEAKVVAKNLKGVNERDRTILRVVLAITGQEDGPSLAEIWALEPGTRAAVMAAPNAANDARLCQLWLSMQEKNLSLDSDHVALVKKG